MGSPVFYIQECPTCGRRLQIRVEYLGKRLACDHCHGRFVARDPSGTPVGLERADIMSRAEALLRSLEDHPALPRLPY